MCICRRSKKNKESTTGKAHKSRSLSELVELVSSGVIQIPQSLMAYAEDKSQLLDQIFTILGSDEIKDMLPDPLKVCQSSKGIVRIDIYYSFMA